MKHSFTETIKQILIDEFEEKADLIYSYCLLLQYINLKTSSAERGSKARSSFGNLYAIYVLVEDYINKGFNINETYKNYEGAKFSALFRRQRELPFGEKLQNHALNDRVNGEFRKFFPTCENIPIIRDVSRKRYWINENLLICNFENQTYNIAESIIKIINQYIEVKQNKFEDLIKQCEQIKNLHTADQYQATNFVFELLAPNVDARLFEIVSYSILKYYYNEQVIYFGFELENIQEENLKLYKTGRTNANDGGIDFVMKPLGRFFQVTETTDVRKYFLDIDKIQRYPITFVIKSDIHVEELKRRIKEKAEEQYYITTIVKQYMDAIEEIINLPILIERFEEAVEKGYLSLVLDEIIKQSKVEFNYDEE
ncbi:restriction endonuclease [Funiculus sociatus GB2-A5]|uniref:Restriction endonuclease n=1 Tax=Funiculus sociatus GB2-A5 TaxID=2933946 RepID=A0ABV0JMJ6_9CYAN|nr:MULTISPECIES: restriction endonuclease [unclassified Trichocoleus]MBD1908286.1 restriction endonuclease [Trichocoleus sp. FACHB-832]MBD2065529.1 restriction endonuclease [Trichocoleus sp. FACHB-6]